MCFHLVLEPLIHFELVLCIVSGSSPVSYKKDLNDPCNHDGVITHLEPDILEYEVKWALGSITMNKASGGDGIPGELFQILKDDVVKKCCTQYASKFGKLISGHKTGKGQFSLQCQRKTRPKNAQTTAQIALTSHVGKVMLKILQARFQQYMSQELPDVQAGFKRGRRTRNQIPTFVGSSKKQENSRKTFTSASLTMLKPLTLWITTNWKILQEMGIPDHFTCLLRNLYAGQEATVKPAMDQWTDSKLGKEYVKVVYCHPAYLTYM